MIHMLPLCALCIGFDRDGGDARSRQYAGTPAVPVKTHYEVLAGLTSMTQYFWPNMHFVLFFGRDGGGDTCLYVK